MFKVILTNVIISKGYDNAPALNFSKAGETDMVRFRIGEKRYDRKAPDNTRWINMSVKAFGSLCERIRNMKLKEGSVINLLGRYDEDHWTDEKTGEKKSLSYIIIDEIEYASLGGKKDPNQSDSSSAATPSAQQYNPAEIGAKPTPNQMEPTASQNFTGFESFGGQSFFDEE